MQKYKILKAIEYILEEGMDVSTAADMVGEKSETVNKWLADYQKEQDVKISQQETEFIEMHKRVQDSQEEIRMHRSTYELIMSHPDPAAEKVAKAGWEKLPDKLKHKVVTNADCVDCGATIITDYVMQGDVEGITLYGKCGKCGKSMSTRVKK